MKIVLFGAEAKLIPTQKKGLYKVDRNECVHENNGYCELTVNCICKQEKKRYS